MRTINHSTPSTASLLIIPVWWRIAIVFLCLTPTAWSVNEKGRAEPSVESERNPLREGYVSHPLNLSRAYEFLIDKMDQYHRCFYVYKDHNAGGNHYPPSGWMGAWSDISFNDGWTTNPAEGTSCIRLSYSAATTSPPWAGIYWQSVDQNWGTTPGFNLSGATELRFQARGEQGGEKAIFKVGGINRQPYHNPRFPHQDSCEAIATGPITLSSDWQTYRIDLSTTETFKVYTEGGAATNSFIPSAWYNESTFTQTMTLDERCTVLPHSGQTCIKITWNGQAGGNGERWNGIGWEWPEGRIQRPTERVQGFDLSRATKLTFWARSDELGLQLQFVFGHPMDSCGQIPPPPPTSVPWIPISTNWTSYSIEIPPGTDLTTVTLGFAVFFNDVHDPGSPGLSFYFDDIEFDKPLRKDLSSLIGGFCWVTNKDMNLNGCTIYLDDIRFDKPRLDSSRFIQSYVTLTGPDEYILNNYASTYDNALALIAFTLRDDSDSRRRARLIADAFVTAQNNDRDFSDGRVRNTYRSGDLMDAFTGKTLLPGWWNVPTQQWWEDRDFVGSKVGELAWAGMALLRFHRVNGGVQYLTAAQRIGDWIIANTRDDRGAGGFTGGYWGWPQGTNNGWYPWKSTEHNEDATAFFSLLYQRTGESKWQQASNHARQFVRAMWNSTDGFFYTGTRDDGVTTNTDFFPLDCNSWGIQAFYPELGEYIRAADWAETSCSTTCNGFWGFDFNSDRDGVWFEGTAQMAVSYRLLEEFDMAERCLANLARAQSDMPNADRRGIVAACHNGLSTGMNWSYNAWLHVGATCWYIFGEVGYNPFQDSPTPQPSATKWWHLFP